ncbi:ABC-three component system protein [Streptococcus constellatus subsp. viborgensis]|uniref:ABC-three component system protein n=1 Tax=Streptococcus constellatus TaxID=76860 RepID=UPI0018E15E09|nr:ABC-three component system protein [Streptococcus constellatus]QQC23102.1 HNH endonuclease [Streptococcus constellatus]
MDFKTFYSILFNRISDTLSSGEFVRDLIAMITTVPEEEWGLKKDPSNRVSSKTYENFAKRGINKTTCKAIVYRLSPENFIESLNTRPKATLELLANDFLPYESTAGKDNIASIMADIFINIIRTTAGLTSVNKLEEQKQLQSSSDLKSKYGKHLLKECDSHCAMPGCGKLLYVSNGNNLSDVYEVTRIDKSKDASIDNLIALCPQCFATYQLDSSTKTVRNLNASKRALSIQMESMIELSTVELEKGLTNVITNIRKLKQQDFFDLTMDPKEINEKIDPNKSFVLYNQVYMTVTTYFIKIKEIMESLDKRKIIDYEELQHQMKSAYKKLKSGKKSESEIFYSLSEKLHKVTLQDILYCQAIVCYFIQSCEVFDAVTK